MCENIVSYFNETGFKTSTKNLVHALLSLSELMRKKLLFFILTSEDTKTNPNVLEVAAILYSKKENLKKS